MIGGISVVCLWRVRAKRDVAAAARWRRLAMVNWVFEGGEEPRGGFNSRSRDNKQERKMRAIRWGGDIKVLDAG